ncbi:MAG TPA: DinB family protein [Terriglobales bacterium]|nr:DinB family protein [Terriglobales bacterium]
MRLNRSIAVVMLFATCAVAFAQQTPAVPEKRTASQVLDRSLSNVEKEFVDAAEAMPEEKYGFAPTNGEFKGVRTFAEQVRHVAATNYDIFAAMLGEKPPVPTQGENENGPANIKTKAEIVKYLRDSFAYGHKAIAAINEQNLVEPIKSPWGENKVTRLGLATLAVGHCFDHYGQMVVYLRSNSIIPPASRR